MLCLSIRQPWAWLILYGGKDIENRDWRTKVRGRVLVHASKGMTREEYEEGLHTQVSIQSHLGGPQGILPAYEKLERGGIIGSVEIVDCVSSHPSPWFFGDFGFVLRNPQALPFTPYRGQLGFFDVPESALRRAA